MGIYVHEMQPGEVAPIFMAAADYCEDADLRTSQMQKRRVGNKSYLIAIEKRFPEIEFNNESLKAQSEKAPLMGMANAAFRHLAAQCGLEIQRESNQWRRTSTGWKKKYK